MEREVLEYDQGPAVPRARRRRRRHPGGLGCFPILAAAVLLWGLGSIFIDGGISCCFSLFLVVILFLIFRLFDAR